MSDALTPEEITIAVTVYNRRRYLKDAIRTALQQTVPVRVLVVDDCGPDLRLREYIREEFGAEVEYARNQRRRGLFGNLNACLELCPTRWLSILHDDDYLSVDFIEEMLELNRHLPGSALYFGSTTMVNDSGERDWVSSANPETQMRRVTLPDLKWSTPFAFPGHLFRTEDARRLGGFRETSRYCGDWEMWAKLVASGGGACTRARVAFYRIHSDWERVSNQVTRSGRVYPLNYVQIKRILHLLRSSGASDSLDRRTYQARRPISIRFLLRHGRTLPPSLLSYHWHLLMLTRPPHLRYALFRLAARLLGAAFLRWSSRSCYWLFPSPRD
jgi:glycosyltransferase involved in cell wall biosynthesis